VARPPKHPVDVKLKIVLSVLQGESTQAEAARRHGVRETSIGKWKSSRRRPRGLEHLECREADGWPGDAPTQSSSTPLSRSHSCKQVRQLHGLLGCRRICDPNVSLISASGLSHRGQVFSTNGR